jgi:hypothetical protein
MSALSSNALACADSASVSRIGRTASRRPASRDAAPKKMDVKRAERTYAACVAVVRITMIGADLREAPGGGGKELYSSSAVKLATALAVYSANVHCEVPLRHLAEAMRADRRDLRRMIQFVERWRAAPLIEQGLETVRRAVAVAA